MPPGWKTQSQEKQEGNNILKNHGGAILLLYLMGLKSKHRAWEASESDTLPIYRQTLRFASLWSNT